MSIISSSRPILSPKTVAGRWKGMLQSCTWTDSHGSKQAEFKRSKWCWKAKQNWGIGVLARASRKRSYLKSDFTLLFTKSGSGEMKWCDSIMYMDGQLKKTSNKAIIEGLVRKINYRIQRIDGQQTIIIKAPSPPERVHQSGHWKQGLKGNEVPYSTQWRKQILTCGVRNMNKINKAVIAVQ